MYNNDEVSLLETMKVNEREFQVLYLLGKGKGGYSYLVSDRKNQYTLKQIHHEPCDYYQFGNKLESELNDYQKLKVTGILMPELLDVDYMQERILKEYIEGKTIKDLVESGQMKQTYYDQIQQISKFLYTYNLNIDYYPTNFIVKEDNLYYIDYECNEYSEQWNYENWGSKYWK